MKNLQLDFHYFINITTLTVVAGTHPIPQNYPDTHRALGKVHTRKSASFKGPVMATDKIKNSR